MLLGRSFYVTLLARCCVTDSTGLWASSCSCRCLKSTWTSRVNLDQMLHLAVQTTRPMPMDQEVMLKHFEHVAHVHMMTVGQIVSKKGGVSVSVTPTHSRFLLLHFNCWISYRWHSKCIHYVGGPACLMFGRESAKKHRTCVRTHIFPHTPRPHTCMRVPCSRKATT